MIVYISIGNSDDKLTQREWSAFWEHTGAAIRRSAAAIHGEWLSPAGGPFQNACWCAEVADDEVEPLRWRLVALARQFRQDSIAWAPVVHTEFLGAG